MRCSLSLYFEIQLYDYLTKNKLPFLEKKSAWQNFKRETKE